jgi:hypothetical protein
MAGRLRCLCFGVVLVLAVFCLWAAAHAGGREGGTPGTSGAAATERISLEVKEVPLQDALHQLFQGTDQSVVVDPSVGLTGQTLTVSLKDVPLEHAVRAICRLHGLDYETDGEGLWAIMAGEDVVISAGRRLPVIGAMRTGEQGQTLELLREAARAGDRPSELSWGFPTYESRVVTRPGGWAGGVAGAELPSGIEGRLVDLEVTDATMGEVAAKLTEAAGEDVEFVVHEAVPADLKVTARVYRMPVGLLCGMLMAQTGLTCSTEVERRPIPEVIGGTEQTPITRSRTKAYYRINIVPQPELSVSGRGIPPRGWGGGRAGGRGGGGGGGRGASD